MSSSPAPSRFILLGTPRSGSNWMMDALSSHHGIEMGGEMLDNPYMRSNPGFAADPWAGLASFWASGRPVKGFKLFHFHCWDSYPEHRGVWDRLGRDKGIKIVLLTRRNLLRLVVSWEMAKATDVWAATSPLADRPKLVMDPAGTIDNMESIEEGLSRMGAIFAGHEKYPLEYEDLFASPDGHLDAIQRMLGVEPRRLGSTQVKMERRSLRDAIANYDEVRAAILKSDYDEFLDD